MSADLDALVALMPFAGQLGLALDEADADRGRTTVTAQTSVYDDTERLVAQTTQVQAVR